MNWDLKDKRSSRDSMEWRKALQSAETAKTGVQRVNPLAVFQ